MVSYIFGGEGLPKTPQELARLRAVAQAMAPQKTPQNVGEGLSSIGNAIAYRLMMNKAAKGEAMGQNAASNAFTALMSGMGGGTPPASPSVSNSTPAPSMAATPSNQPPIPGIQPQQSSSSLPGSFLAAVDRTEGAGGYDTLYGHAQKNAFAGTDVSKMPIADVLAFTDPSGAYAQSVKGQIGRVATPVGRYQVVGTTLRKAVNALGLDPSQPFDAATQDRVAAYLATERVKSAGSLPEKISALRSEWHGFKGVPDSEMAQIVADLENGGGAMSAMNAQPGMAATADIPMGGASQEISASVPGYVDPMVSAPNSRAPVAQALAQQPMQPVQTAQAGNSRRGIMEALMGGQPQTQDMPADYFPAAPSAPGATSPSRQQIMRVLTDQFATPEQKAIATDMYQQMQQANDPLRQLEIKKLEKEINAKPERKTTVVNGRLVDANTGELVAEYPDQVKPTADIQNYEYYVKAEQAAGRQPLGPLEYEIAQKKAGATNISNTIGGEPSDTALRKKLDEKTGELWSTYQATGANSASSLQDFDMLDELIKVAPQGPLVGRLAQALPGVSSAADAFQSIVKRVAPTLRAPGSGATSDIEYDGMLRSLPSLVNKPEANVAINQMMRSKAAINVERSRVIDEYSNGKLTASQARDRMAEIDKRSIMTPELKGLFGNLTNEPAADTTPAPEGMDMEIWQEMTPEERALWQN